MKRRNSDLRNQLLGYCCILFGTKLCFEGLIQSVQVMAYDVESSHLEGHVF